jgi:rhomboid protease GluP
MRRRTPVTWTLLIVITIVFAFEAVTNAWNNDDLLIAMGALMPHVERSGEWWRVLTSMFLHGGWLHWAANSWTLYQLGTLFELLFGSRRFAITYFVSGIVAGIASSMYLHGPAVGASGAIFGILGAFIFSVWRSPQYRHQPWTKSLIAQLVFWIAVNIVISYRFPFIDKVAHLAGLITGLFLGFIPHRVPPPPPREMVVDAEPLNYR